MGEPRSIKSMVLRDLCSVQFNERYSFRACIALRLVRGISRRFGNLRIFDERVSAVNVCEAQNTDECGGKK